jgi:hypothetical protein
MQGIGGMRVDTEGSTARKRGVHRAVGDGVLRVIIGRATAPGRNRLGQLLTSLGTPVKLAVGFEQELTRPLGSAHRDGSADMAVLISNA